MGQYYYVVNVDKRQYLNPHKFADGLKLLEFGASQHGTMTALAILLSSGCGRGGGDLRGGNPIIGTWAGDRIVVAGDYADDGAFVSDADAETWRAANGVISDSRPTLNEVARSFYEDVSARAIAAMVDDKWLRDELRRRFAMRGPLMAEGLSEATLALLGAPAAKGVES